jgi:hypothetical protein
LIYERAHGQNWKKEKAKKMDSNTGDPALALKKKEIGENCHPQSFFA